MSNAKRIKKKSRTLSINNANNRKFVWPKKNKVNICQSIQFMYASVLKLLVVSSVFCLFGCNANSNSRSADEVKFTTKKILKQNALKNKNPKDFAVQEKLQGIWKSNHESVAIELFEDGSYRRFIPGGYAEPDTPEEEFDNGIWFVEDGFLSLQSESGQKESLFLSWIEDELLYFGNIEDEYDPEYGSIKEFAEELGFSKVID